jgi:hypothetical protein
MRRRHWPLAESIRREPKAGEVSKRENIKQPTFNIELPSPGLSPRPGRHWVFVVGRWVLDVSSAPSKKGDGHA